MRVTENFPPIVGLSPLPASFAKTRANGLVNKNHAEGEIAMGNTQASNPESLGNVPVLSGIVPYLCVEGASKAAEFYKKAFGACEVARHPVDEQGRTMHIHLHLNSASLMLSDPYPDHGHPYKPQQGCTLHLKVDDVDAWWKRAVEAGVTVGLPLQLMFWGERYGQFTDPFGVDWSVGGK